MKTIIAPIDFSDISINALWYAGEISKRTAAKLIIVNIMDSDADEEAVNSDLEYAISGLHSFIGADLHCESVAVRGNFVSALKGLIGLHQPDLIVMGTQGATGLKRILIGSNTVHVLSNVQVPVLVIPEVAKFEHFLNKGKNRVVLATDLDQLNDDNALNILKEIALLIEEPKIRIVSIRPGKQDMDDSKREQREALVSRFRPEVPTEWYTVFHNSVLGGINYYLNKNTDTGLVAMVARDSGYLIQKHFTREMASHTEYPLLVIHDD
jgi:nucleotide-binding universal stress UspA family protein